MIQGIVRDQARALAAAFVALFSVVGFALYGLPFFYDFFVQDLGWTRQQVTSGNALSKVVIGPLFGFLAGSIIDRFGVRRLMLAGIVMAGFALVGLSGGLRARPAVGDLGCSMSCPRTGEWTSSPTTERSYGSRSTTAPSSNGPVEAASAGSPGSEPASGTL